MPQIHNLIPVVLVMTTVGALFYVFVYPYLSGDRAREQRHAQIKGEGGRKKSGDRIVDQERRRKQIAESLKDIESAGKKKRQTLESRLAQAGLEWDTKTFVLFSVALGLFGAVVAFLTNGEMMAIAGGALIGGLALPRWIISFIAKRRTKKFLGEFPNAVDIIIRGVKAGLPLQQCLAIIAGEAAEPVRTEFRRIVEAQAIGLTVGEAVDRLTERMPLPEANFFSIVINLQQKSGGNLSEALGNLSRVLRDRKKMRLKIVAMSSEAKSSAAIIGALPFAVGGMVSFTQPDYMKLLFITSSGKIVVAVCLFWMGLGIFLMRKMINFDF
ncbi:MAG: type II secretion system F family protein [Hyphomicrobiales bacterium]|nr:type II secretion system F family protein [Hyphomicrobiales bacterium]